MDEKLRLLAELKDNMSSGLAKINKEMKQTKRTPGMEQAQKWYEGFSATTKEASKAGGALSSVLGAVGVGGLGAAASVAVLARQMKELGDHAFAMKRLGQETGMAIDQVRRWEYVGQVFRVPVEQVDAALKEFGDKMLDFKNRRGALFGELNQRNPDEARKLLGLKDADAQFHEVLRMLGTIKDTALRNRWAREFFGSDDIDALLTNGMPALEKAMRDARTRVSPISPEMQKQADDLASSVASLNQSVENFELKAGPAFLKSMTGIVDLLGKEVDFLKDFAAHPKDLLPHFGPPTADQAEKLKKGREQFDKNPSFYLNPFHWFGRQKPSDSLEKKTAFGSANGLLHMAAFGGEGASGAGSFGIEATIASGTKIGVLAAFREWAAEKSAGDSGGGPGFQNASFETGTGGGGGRGFSGLGGVGGGGGGGVGGRVPEETRKLAMHLMDRLIKVHGFTPEAAAISAGNADQESTFRSGAAGDNGRSNGMFQWDATRLARLKTFAAAQGKNWTDFDTQVDFHAKEVEQYIPGYGKNASMANAGAYSKRYEGYRIEGNRVGYANRWLQTYRNGGQLPAAAGGASVPGHITGQLKMGDESYRFGSGGVRGASSIPFGDYPITPNAIGAWGRANGAIGVNNDHIWDKSLGRMRDGIEMHVGHSFNLITEGCLAFEKEQFPKLKARINQMIQEHGHAYLHVGKGGASITSSPNVGSLVDEARKARERSEQAEKDGSIEAHVHIHDGQVRGASAKSSGAVKPPKVHLRRGPTMTEPTLAT